VPPSNQASTDSHHDAPQGASFFVPHGPRAGCCRCCGHLCESNCCDGNAPWDDPAADDLRLPCQARRGGLANCPFTQELPLKPSIPAEPAQSTLLQHAPSRMFAISCRPCRMAVVIPRTNCIASHLMQIENSSFAKSFGTVPKYISNISKKIVLTFRSRINFHTRKRCSQVAKKALTDIRPARVRQLIA